MPGRALKAAPVSLVLLAAASLTVTARLGMASGHSNSLPQVRGISIHCPSNQAAVIDIATTRPARYQTFRLRNPERLVVDLKGVRKATLQSVYEVQSSILKRVRVGQWQSNPPIVRIVADLKGTPASTVHADASGIWIKLKPRTSVKTPATRLRSQRGRVTSNEAASAPGTSHARDPKSLFAVHQFADLTASLTGPDIPPRDHLVPVTAPQPPTEKHTEASPPALVSQITIKPARYGGANVDIASSRPVPYRIFQLPHPFRLVIYLKDARDGTGKDICQVDSSILKSVRVAQWRSGELPIVRVVADLAGDPIFDVYAKQPGIRINLRPRPRLRPLVRNPFEFAIHHPSARVEHLVPNLNRAMTAGINSPAVQPGNSFSDLKVIGYIDGKNSGMQAIISDKSNIYFVPEGGTIEKTFRVLAISGNGVKLQNINTLQTRRLAYTH